MAPDDQVARSSADEACDQGRPFVRAFVALAVSEGVRGRLVDVQRDLKRSGAHVAWVAPENIHLSLAFLGDIPPNDVQRVAVLLSGIAAEVFPFVFDCAGLGVFGNPRSPRVVWAGVRESTPLRQIQGLLVRGLGDVGIEVDAREFRPHLTLGRVRSPRGAGQLCRVMERHALEEFGDTRADSLHLMRSVLTPAGAHYTLLHAAPMAVAPPG
jgi:RNA 2',3'-cyclic 3'-phosphodiesterase